MNKENLSNVDSTKNEIESENYFDGEHFEGHGDKWTAVFGDSDKFLLNYLQKSIQDGELGFVNDSEEYRCVGTVYPKDSPISVFSLIELGDTCNEYVSSSPLLSGLNNEVKLKATYSWEVKGEGEFAVETKSEKIISFFDPFYAKDKKMFEKDKIQNISLSGLAYSCHKLEEQEFVLDKGKSFEFFRNEFLNENPDKNEKDFEPPVVRLDSEHFRMIIPREYSCEYEIATQIEDIEYIDVLGEKFAKMKVNLENVIDDEYLYSNIYASENVLKGFNPQVGDGIVAVVWLTGVFN